MNSGASVLIVAKPGSVRNGLQALLSSIVGIQSVELADDCLEALKLNVERQATLILLEGGRPDTQVWYAVREIKRTWPHTRCIVLVTDVEQQQSADGAIADAVVLHGTPPTELVATIERLLD